MALRCAALRYAAALPCVARNLSSSKDLSKPQKSAGNSKLKSTIGQFDAKPDNGLPCTAGLDGSDALVDVAEPHVGN